MFDDVTMSFFPLVAMLCCLMLLCTSTHFFLAFCLACLAFLFFACLVLLPFLCVRACFATFWCIAWIFPLSWLFSSPISIAPHALTRTRRSAPSLRLESAVLIPSECACMCINYLVVSLPPSLLHSPPLVVVGIVHVGSIPPSSSATVESVCCWLDRFVFAS